MWLRRLNVWFGLKKAMTAARQPRRWRKHAPLRYERLEDRTVPTTNSWTGSVSNLWYEAGNWTNGIPADGQDILISNVANTPDVLSAAVADIASLTSSQPVNVEGTTLTLTGGGSVVTGGLNVTGGAALIISGNGDISVTTSSQTFGGDGTGSVVFRDKYGSNAVIAASGLVTDHHHGKYCDVHPNRGRQLHDPDVPEHYAESEVHRDGGAAAGRQARR
jgi:hypothetical protein